MLATELKSNPNAAGFERRIGLFELVALGPVPTKDQYPSTVF